MGKPKCLYTEKLAWGGEWPYHRKRVTQLGRSPLSLSQLFVSHLNSSSSFVRKCRKSWLTQGSLGWRVTLLLQISLLHINRVSKPHVLSEDKLQKTNRLLADCHTLQVIHWIHVYRVYLAERWIFPQDFFSFLYSSTVRVSCKLPYRLTGLRS